MSALHTNEVQGQMYWPHSERFNGVHGSFLVFTYGLIKQISWTKENSREGTRSWKIQERSIKYLTLIYIYNIASKKEIVQCERVNRYRQAIRQIPLANTSSSKVEAQEVVVKYDSMCNEVTETSDPASDIEEPIDEEKPGSWPKGWLPKKDEREVGKYFLKVVEASICDMALNVVIAMGNPKDRNGFMAIERLADVHGRNTAHIAMMPQLFTWGEGKNLLPVWNK